MPRKAPRVKSLDEAQASCAAKLAKGIISQEEYEQFVKLHEAARAFEAEHAAIEKQRRTQARARAQQLLAAASKRSERQLRQNGSPHGGSFRGLLAGVANAVAKKFGAVDSPSSFGSFRSAGSESGSFRHAKPPSRTGSSSSLLSAGDGVTHVEVTKLSPGGGGGGRKTPLALLHLPPHVHTGNMDVRENCSDPRLLSPAENVLVRRDGSTMLMMPPKAFRCLCGASPNPKLVPNVVVDSTAANDDDSGGGGRAESAGDASLKELELPRCDTVTARQVLEKLEERRQTLLLECDAARVQRGAAPTQRQRRPVVHTNSVDSVESYLDPRKRSPTTVSSDDLTTWHANPLAKRKSPARSGAIAAPLVEEGEEEDSEETEETEETEEIESEKEDKDGADDDDATGEENGAAVHQAEVDSAGTPTSPPPSPPRSPQRPAPPAGAESPAWDHADLRRKYALLAQRNEALEAAVAFQNRELNRLREDVLLAQRGGPKGGGGGPSEGATAAWHDGGGGDAHAYVKRLGQHRRNLEAEVARLEGLLERLHATVASEVDAAQRAVGAERRASVEVAAARKRADSAEQDLDRALDFIKTSLGPAYRLTLAAALDRGAFSTYSSVGAEARAAVLTSPTHGKQRGRGDRKETRVEKEQRRRDSRLGMSPGWKGSQLFNF